MSFCVHSFLFLQKLYIFRVYSTSNSDMQHNLTLTHVLPSSLSKRWRPKLLGFEFQNLYDIYKPFVAPFVQTLTEDVLACLVTEEASNHYVMALLLRLERYWVMRNLDGCGVRVIATGDKGEGDTEFFNWNLLNIEYESCWNKKWLLA